MQTGTLTMKILDLEPHKGRSIDLAKPVDVYRNLHKDQKWSIRQNGVVVGHCSAIWLRDVQFRVQEAGRQRVLETGYKCIHAYVRGVVVPGEWQDKNSSGINDFRMIVYNPRHHSSFMCPLGSTSRPVTKAGLTLMNFEGGRSWVRSRHPRFI